MTAEQQQVAREASEAARSAALHEAGERRAERAAMREQKREQKRVAKQDAPSRERAASASRTGRIKKRSAKNEDFHEPERKRKPIEPARPRASLALGTPAKVGLAVLALVVVICAILYPPAKSYYQALRTEQHDQAVLEAVQSANGEKAKKNEELKTDEGKENAAREQLGWTKDGENAAVISNLDESSGGDGYPEQVNPDEVKAPQTWYYQVLDVIFFVQQ